ncbi:hypothetical protein QUA97_22580 [Microcoleus sp. CZ3-B2]|nr:hypothetical protein [Tychonema sp. LEGE 06208]
MNEINTGRMKLSQIQALIAVADCENFSEAALLCNWNCPSQQSATPSHF